jgi:hypothetical protein
MWLPQSLWPKQYKVLSHDGQLTHNKGQWVASSRDTSDCRGF